MKEHTCVGSRYPEEPCVGCGFSNINYEKSDDSTSDHTCKTCKYAEKTYVIEIPIN